MPLSRRDLIGNPRILARQTLDEFRLGTAAQGFEVKPLALLPHFLRELDAKRVEVEERPLIAQPANLRKMVGAVGALLQDLIIARLGQFLPALDVPVRLLVGVAPVERGTKLVDLGIRLEVAGRIAGPGRQKTAEELVCLPDLRGLGVCLALLLVGAGELGGRAPRSSPARLRG